MKQELITLPMPDRDNSSELHSVVSEEDSPRGQKTVETNATGEPVVIISPSENVFSFVFFMIPIEELRAPGKLTTPKILAWLIMILVLILQAVIIFAIWNAIVLNAYSWQLSVVSSAPPEGYQQPNCNKGGSLCQKMPDGKVTCAPPTVQLSGRWDELDADGDGNWTRAEAEAAKNELGCRFPVNPVEVFDVYSNFLVNRQNIIWIHPAVRAGQGIPKAYFDYAVGDIIMCGYRDAYMCPNLLKRGVFDAPLTHGKVPRVGVTIASALKYCHEMLEEGGVCDRTLPSTYTVWKRSSEDQCYGPNFHKFVYEHPVSNRTKSMLEVSYDATKDYQKAQKSSLFAAYKACVILVLLFTVFADAKELIPMITFLMVYPSAREVESIGRKAVEVLQTDPDDDDDVVYTVNGVTASHRASLAVVVLARAVMFFAMTFVGMVFLLKETDYLNLILNGLGLLFIVVLPRDLYLQLLSPYMRSKVQCVRPIEVPMRGIDALNRSPSLKDILWIAVVLTVLFCSMKYYAATVVLPVTQALDCACLSEGPKCREAETFSTESFWDNYWQFEVPRTIKEIKVFEENYKFESSVSKTGMPGVSSTSHHRPANFFQDGHARGLKYKGKHSVNLKTDVVFSEKSVF
jgi:hypothetical protein